MNNNKDLGRLHFYAEYLRKKATSLYVIGLDLLAEDLFWIADNIEAARKNLLHEEEDE